MAYTTINKSGDYFNTKLRSGVSSGTQANTGVGFQPDLIWDKNRASGIHAWWDVVRGNTKQLQSNSTGAETTVSQLASFDSDGFTINGSADHGSGTNIVDWCWKAGGAGSANTDGTVNTTVSANTTAGFSIVTYTGDGNNNATFGHGLGAIPKVVLVKTRDNSRNWYMRHESLSSGYNIMLNLTETPVNASSYNAGMIKDLDNANTFSIAKSGSTNPTNNNGTGEDYVAYCFVEKTGYSKFGSYKGNGDATRPPFIYTGFKPKFVIVKNISQTDSWFMHDDKRDGYNDDNEYLFPNSNSAEGSNVNRIRLLSNGFSVPTTDKSHNVSGNSYIYMAFGQSLVGSNNVPATAR